MQGGILIPSSGTPHPIPILPSTNRQQILRFTCQGPADRALPKAN